MMPERDDDTLDETGALAGATPGDDELGRSVDVPPSTPADTDDADPVSRADDAAP